MRRELNPVFLRARDALEGVLGLHGYQINEETSHPAAFGSAQVEYRHRTHWLRLTWDGKEQSLWLEGAVLREQHAYPVAEDWRPLAPPAPGTPHVPLNEASATGARIAEMLSQFEVFRQSRAAV